MVLTVLNWQIKLASFLNPSLKFNIIKNLKAFKRNLWYAIEK